MTDVLINLPRLKWRGITYPVIDRSISFLHENVDHRIQYRANDFPEPIGPHSFLFKYSIPMREDLARNIYGSLFNEGLPLLVRDMRNKEPGDLLDPVLGTYRCIPVSYTETTSVDKRDGTDVQVEFLHAPRIGDSDPELPPTILGVAVSVAESGMGDQDLAKRDWNQEPSPDGVTDILSAINGIGRQGLRQVDKLASQLDSLSLKMQKIEDTADAAENPQNWRIRESARRLHLDIIDAKNRLTEDPVAKVKRLTVRVNTTLSSLASTVGMTLLELITLNPSLSRSPVIKSGAVIYVKKKVDSSTSS